MNFLGHAFLARFNPELMAGNFAGDSYKGNLDKFHYLPAHIQDGILLHRKIDDLTDSNPHIKKAGKILQDKGINRVAFIATDIIVDYYLSSRWQSYAELEYEVFLTKLYESTDANLHHLEDDFCLMYDRLKKYKWMHQYNTLEGMDQIIWQFSRRIPFKNDLQQAFLLYKDEPEEMDDLFHRFLIDIDISIQDFIRFRLKRS